MTSIGTNHIAASAAQTAQQAEKVARKRDEQRARDLQRQRQVQDLFETHLTSLTDADESRDAQQTRIDEQIPDHPQSHEVRGLAHRLPHEQHLLPPHARQGPDGETLYKHVDVQA